MAYVQTTQTTSFFGSLTAFFKRVAADMKARSEAKARYNTTFRELSALSNRDLADLGISRSMIRGLAQEAAERG